MIYVSQLQGNDCLRACVATILSVPPESLPSPPTEFTDENWDEYMEELRQAVRERGFELLLLASDDGDFAPRGMAIASYQSPSKKERVLHAVVARNGEVVWDPSPIYREQDIVYEGPPRDWMVFQSLEPARLSLKKGATNEEENGRTCPMRMLP